MYEITETLKLQIYPTPEQIAIFEYSQQQFIKACQYISDYAFNYHVLDARKLHDALYYRLRKLFDLPAQITASIFRVVSARYKTVRTQFKKQHVKYRDHYTGKWESY